MANISERIALNILFAAIAVFAGIIYSGKIELVLQKVNEIVHRKKGCNPLPSVGNVSLHYFAVRGRAESIRMLMQDNLIPYEETMYSKDTWKELKESGLAVIYAFGQVPYIQTSKGTELVQSHAIVHFLGRSVGLDCDCKDLHHCEMMSLGVEDFRQKLSRVMYDPKFSYKTRNEYITGTMKLWLQHFEYILLKSEEVNGQRYFGGNRITWIDYLVFDLLEVHDSFIAATHSNSTMKDNVFLDEFPTLKTFYTAFAKRPWLQRYLSSTERLSFALPIKPM